MALDLKDRDYIKLFYLVSSKATNKCRLDIPVRFRLFYVKGNSSRFGDSHGLSCFSRGYRQNGWIKSIVVKKH